MRRFASSSASAAVQARACASMPSRSCCRLSVVRKAVVGAAVAEGVVIEAALWSSWWTGGFWLVGGEGFAERVLARECDARVSRRVDERVGYFDWRVVGPGGVRGWWSGWGLLVASAVSRLAR